MIDTNFQNSLCATEKLHKEFLLKLLGSKTLAIVLLYRGSEHGWGAEDFHLRCNNKGATISLFKILNGDCIGGFTTAQWCSHYEWLAD